MDVVRRNIAALRGAVEIASRPGEGTVLTIRLPLTLALIPGFLVAAGGERYVVPLESVVECLDLPERRVGHRPVRRHRPARRVACPTCASASVLGAHAATRRAGRAWSWSRTASAWPAWPWTRCWARRRSSSQPLGQPLQAVRGRLGFHDPRRRPRGADPRRGRADARGTDGGERVMEKPTGEAAVQQLLSFQMGGAALRGGARARARDRPLRAGDARSARAQPACAASSTCAAASCP